ncbi:MAG: hypothetical protein AD742_15740 [Methylibium sp. NZG]|nr:MAG: hypothetical protein AD742_15740 [Methylibium sp. NZG]
MTQDPQPGPLADLAADWPQLSRLLDEALALPAAQREVWLDGHTGLSAPLKTTLRRLLDAQAAAETGDFMRSLQGRLPLPPNGEEGPLAGDTVGPWRLVRLLGEGGMGSVWLAERADGLLKRPVALKLPRLTWVPGLAARLARERDILAALDHPNIVRLLDAGVDASGRPWLALEHVDGQPLDAYARGAKPTLRDRVSLLLQVAAAVAFAHARLVVHRDLKPSNIFVTANGEVRLLDFGIAKLLGGDEPERTALTQVGGRALTLDYASPEQVRGEPLGVATDVYSLGVVAFELLAGARPFRRTRDSAAALEEAILLQDAPLASSLAADAATARALRGDLDAILNQALKKAVGERYSSIDALAADWRRWLRDEPVAARPDSVAYRLRKFMQRRRVEVVVGGIVAFALVGAAGVSTWQAQRAEAARALAEQEAATARSVQAFVESVFLANSGDQARPGAGRETTARDLLDRGAQRIGTELKQQPVARVRLLGLMAGMYEDLSEFGRMRELAEMRVAQAAELAPGAREPEQVMALADLAHALAISGREADARARLDEAEAVMQRAQLTDAPLRLRLLVRRGSVHRADDPERAAAAAEQAWALAGRLPPSQDQVIAAYLVAEARVHHKGESEGALRVLNEAVPLLERRPDLGASILAPMHTLKGDAEFKLGRLDAAEASYRRGIAVERARGGSGALPNQLAQQFAQFLVRQERWRDAVDVLQPSWEWARTHTKDYETTVPMVSVTFGQALVAMGRLSEGLTALDLAVEQVARLQDAADIAPRIAAWRAMAWVRAQRLRDAELALASIDFELANRQMRSPPQVEQARREIQLARGRGSDALAGWRAERKAAGRTEVPDARKEPVAAVESARLVRASGDSATALAQAQAVIAAFDERAASGTPWRGATPAIAWQVAGEALLQLGRHREAAEALEQAAALLRPHVDTSRSLQLASLLGSLADAAKRTGQAERAAALVREAGQITRLTLGESG